jgi:hypothetical protein
LKRKGNSELSEQKSTAPGTGSLTFRAISRLAGHRLGVADVPCPSCGPDRRSPANQRRKVLRVWRVSPTFVTYR